MGCGFQYKDEISKMIKSATLNQIEMRYIASCDCVAEGPYYNYILKLKKRFENLSKDNKSYTFELNELKPFEWLMEEMVYGRNIQKYFENMDGHNRKSFDYARKILINEKVKGEKEFVKKFVDHCDRCAVQLASSDGNVYSIYGIKRAELDNRFIDIKDGYYLTHGLENGKRIAIRKIKDKKTISEFKALPDVWKELLQSLDF